MNPIYAGNCSIEEVPGSSLTQKRGQAATLVRVFEGAANDLLAFLASNVVLSTDEAIPSMVLDEYHCEYDGPQVKVTLTYYGLPSGPASNPSGLQSNASWSPKSTVLSTDNPADGDWIVNYMSPTITYRYTSSAKIRAPQYQDFADFPDDITLADAQQISSPDGPPAPGYMRQGQFQYATFSIPDGFSRDQKGTIYNYAETWAVLIQKPKNQSAGTLSLNGAIAPSGLNG